MEPRMKAFSGELLPASLAALPAGGPACSDENELKDAEMSEGKRCEKGDSHFKEMWCWQTASQGEQLGRDEHRCQRHHPPASFSFSFFVSAASVASRTSFMPAQGGGDGVW
jgi:hypothetical protein